MQIFCTLFICFVLDSLFLSTCFPMFCSKHLITFENTDLLCCWFHCVDIFNIKFRFCETFTVIYSVTRTLLTETLYKFRTIKYWFTLHLQIHVWASINSNVLFIPPHVLVFHMIFALSQLKTSGICTVSNNQKTYFAF